MGRLISFFLIEHCGCGGLSLLSRGYLLFFAAGVVSFTVLVSIEMRRLRLAAEYFYVLFISLIFGLAGARVIPIIQAFASPKGLSWQGVIHGGMVFYGGLGGVYLASFILLRARRLRPFPYIDIISLYVPLAHSFGRIGCFLVGCCFGRITQSRIGVSYPVGSPAYTQHLSHGMIYPESVKSLPVIPVQILEAVLNVIIFAVLYAKKPRANDGELTATYLILYAVCRFFIEFMRDDAIRGIYSGISTAQYISAAIIIAGIYTLLLLNTKIRS
ncbi:MAG: prolipoprotein diacylglyceryl transferase [Nitrospirae bacterium]|nr:prolipoprotein diacylglyceryl transferase [Nitrospirota bacterium]